MKKTLENNKKVYTEGWVMFASYVGGPLAASYLISKNFSTFEEENMARNTLMVGIILSIILFTSLMLIPEAIMDKVPNSLIPITYTAGFYAFMKKYQNKKIKEHLSNNGKKKSGWKVTGIAILCLIITVLFIIALLTYLPKNLMT